MSQRALFKMDDDRGFLGLHNAVHWTAFSWCWAMLDRGRLTILCWQFCGQMLTQRTSKRLRLDHLVGEQRELVFAGSDTLRQTTTTDYYDRLIRQTTTTFLRRWFSASVEEDALLSFSTVVVLKWFLASLGKQLGKQLDKHSLPNWIELLKSD